MTTYRPAARCSIRGFTLLEVVIVLSIMVVLASLSWPAMLRYVRERAIREQAHVVRIELAGARIRAIDTGLVYQFRYEPGGRRFIVLPHDRPDIGSGDGAADAGNAAVARAVSSGVEVVSGQLAEPCRFAVPTARNVVTHADQAVVTEKLPEEWLALVPDSNSLRETSWAPAICFYADGVCDDAKLSVTDSDDRRVDVHVRGLTGSVTTGRVEQERRL